MIIEMEALIYLILTLILIVVIKRIVSKMNYLKFSSLRKTRNLS